MLYVLLSIILHFCLYIILYKTLYIFLHIISQHTPAHSVVHTTRAWTTPMDWCCIRPGLGQPSDHIDIFFSFVPRRGRGLPSNIFHLLVDKFACRPYHHGLGSDPPEGRVLPRKWEKPTASWSWDESPSIAPFVLQRPFHNLCDRL